MISHIYTWNIIQHNNTKRVLLVWHTWDKFLSIGSSKTLELIYSLPNLYSEFINERRMLEEHKEKRILMLTDSARIFVFCMIVKSKTMSTVLSKTYMNIPYAVGTLLPSGVSFIWSYWEKLQNKPHERVIIHETTRYSLMSHLFDLIP